MSDIVYVVHKSHPNVVWTAPRHRVEARDQYGWLWLTYYASSREDRLRLKASDSLLLTDDLRCYVVKHEIYKANEMLVVAAASAL